MKFKKYLIGMLSIIIMLLAIGCTSSNESSENNKGEAVIATSVAVTEILDAIGVKVDGIPTTSYELPESTKGAVEVGSPMNPDLEIIKSLNPKVVVSVDTLGQDFMDSFVENNIPSEFINLTSLEGLKNSIYKLGETFDKQDNAKKVLEEINNKESELSTKFEDKEKPKILTIFGAPGSMMLATDKSYVGNIVKLAGGENIIESDKLPFMAVNKEEIAKLNPDKILVMVHAEPEKTKKMVEQNLETDTAWKSLDAVKNGKVHYLDSTYFGMSANLKVIEAMNIMNDIIYN